MTDFANPNARRLFLGVLHPYDPAADATTTLYIGTDAFTTRPADDPADVYFEPIIQDGISFERSMARPGAVGGRSLPGRGALRLVNTGDFDHWLDYNFDGRRVSILSGEAGEDWAEFETVFEGVTGEAGFGRLEIVLPLLDNRDRLDRPLQETLFSGAGGVEGGDDLKSKPKPVCLGECRNITPVLVDATARTYQVNDGAIEAIDGIYDNGRALAAADYTADLAAGRFTLAAQPNGLVTADVRGDKRGGVYVSTAADMLRRLAVDFGGLGDPGDLDTASFSALNVKTTATLGVYTGTAARNLLDVMDEVAVSVGGHHGFNRAGLLSVGRLEAPSGTPVIDIDEGDIERGGLGRESFGSPAWRRRVGYGRSWTVQLPDQLDGAATEAFKTFAAEEFRIAAAEDDTVKQDGPGNDGHKMAADPEPVATLLVEKTDAETEAARLLALYGRRRAVYRVATRAAAFAVDLGDVVRLVHPRFGLAAGRDLIVVRFFERAALGEVELDLWG